MKLLYAEIITLTLLASLLLNVTPLQGMPTFVIEALRLVSDVQLVKRLLLLNEWLIQHYRLIWQEFTTCFVTKATPINSIDGVRHTKKLKSSRTYLTDYLGFISCKQFLLTWGAYTCTHTHKHTYQCPHESDF